MGTENVNLTVVMAFRPWLLVLLTVVPGRGAEQLTQRTTSENGRREASIEQQVRLFRSNRTIFSFRSATTMLRAIGFDGPGWIPGRNGLVQFPKISPHSECQRVLVNIIIPHSMLRSGMFSGVFHACTMLDSGLLHSILGGGVFHCSQVTLGLVSTVP